MNETKETDNKTKDTIQVPEYYYAVDVDYLTHMICNFFLFFSKKKKEM